MIKVTQSVNKRGSSLSCQIVRTRYVKFDRQQLCPRGLVKNFVTIIVKRRQSTTKHVKSYRTAVETDTLEQCTVVETHDGRSTIVQLSDNHKGRDLSSNREMLKQSVTGKSWFLSFRLDQTR